MMNNDTLPITLQFVGYNKLRNKGGNVYPTFSSNGTFVVHNATFVVLNGTFVLLNDTFVVLNGTFVILNEWYFCAAPSNGIAQFGHSPIRCCADSLDNFFYYLVVLSFWECWTDFVFLNYSCFF